MNGESESEGLDQYLARDAHVSPVEDVTRFLVVGFLVQFNRHDAMRAAQLRWVILNPLADLAAADAQVVDFRNDRFDFCQRQIEPKSRARDDRTAQAGNKMRQHIGIGCDGFAHRRSSEYWPVRLMVSNFNFCLA